MAGDKFVAVVSCGASPGPVVVCCVRLQSVPSGWPRPRPSGTLIDVPGVAAVVTLASVMLALPAELTVKEKNCEPPGPCNCPSKISEVGPVVVVGVVDVSLPQAVIANASARTIGRRNACLITVTRLRVDDRDRHDDAA